MRTEAKGVPQQEVPSTMRGPKRRGSLARGASAMCGPKHRRPLPRRRAKVHVFFRKNDHSPKRHAKLQVNRHNIAKIGPIVKFTCTIACHLPFSTKIAQKTCTFDFCGSFFSYLLMFSRRRNSEFWIIRSGLPRRHFLVSASCHKYHRPYSCEQSRISVSVALLPPAFRREEHGRQEVNSNRPPIVVKALPGNDQRIRGSCWHDSRSMRLKRRFPELEALPARADIPGQGFSTCIPPIYDTGALRSSRRCQASE